MKDLVIAAVIVAVLIGGWAVFDHYSEKKIDSFSSYIEDEIIPSVEDENWDECRQLIDTLSHRWHKYKKKSTFLSGHYRNQRNRLFPGKNRKVRGCPRCFQLCR